MNILIMWVMACGAVLGGLNGFWGETVSAWENVLRKVLSF